MVNAAPTKTGVLSDASLYQVNTGFVTVVLLAVRVVVPALHNAVLPEITISAAIAFWLTMIVTGVRVAFVQPPLDAAST